MSAPIIISCLLTGVFFGWLGCWSSGEVQDRGSSDATLPAGEQALALPEEAGVSVAFSGIRAELAQHFELLDKFVKRMPASDVEEFDDVLLRDAKALTKTLALVYDDIRRLGDRLPVAEDSRTDAETATGNRLALEEWLQMHFAYLSRYGNEFSIALFEIESKEEGEKSASSAADEVEPMQGGTASCQITDLLKESIRGTDKIFRYSPNEFVVALPETPLEGAIIFADRAVQNAKAAIQCSVYGGATSARHTDSLRTLMNRADSALYQAKSEEENSVCFHDGQRIGSPVDVPYEPSGPRS